MGRGGPGALAACLCLPCVASPDVEHSPGLPCTLSPLLAGQCCPGRPALTRPALRVPPCLPAAGGFKERDDEEAEAARQRRREREEREE